VIVRERELNRFWYLRLWSYYHLKESNGIMKKGKKVELFLDSGAFSAWSQDKEIQIQDYIQFIKDNENVIDVYANLDVIGDAKGTYNNQRIMEKAGLNPLPVFHYGEDIKWLKKYLSYPYITLGGMVPISNNALIAWLDNLFENYLTDDKGIPICKIHGFGLTSLKLMLRYPWYSVDSTSWVVTGRMGSIYVPRRKGGEWVYNENSWKIAVSNRSPDKKEAGKHIDTMSPAEKQVFLDYIHEKGYKLGKSEYKEVKPGYKLKDNERWLDKKPKNKTTNRKVEVIVEDGVSNRYQLRDEMNIIYFLDLEKRMPKWPWPFKTKTKQKGLF
jgi:hypothetical protein